MIATNRLYPIGWGSRSEGLESLYNVAPSNIELYNPFGPWPAGAWLSSLSPCMPCPYHDSGNHAVEEKGCYCSPPLCSPRWLFWWSRGRLGGIYNTEAGICGWNLQFQVHSTLFLTSWQVLMLSIIQGSGEFKGSNIMAIQAWTKRLYILPRIHALLPLRPFSTEYDLKPSPFCKCLKWWPGNTSLKPDTIAINHITSRPRCSIYHV